MTGLDLSRIQWLENGFSVQQEQYCLDIELLQEEVVRVRSYPLKDASEKPTYDASCEMSSIRNVSFVRHDDGQIVGFTSETLTVQFNGEYLCFLRGNRTILKEYARTQHSTRRTVGVDNHIPIQSVRSSSLRIAPHTFRQIDGGMYHSYLRFEADPSEKIFGLGGYQEMTLDKNGGYYELMQRNSQTSIPIYFSDKGYGFLWNNSGVGEVHFANNHYCWSSYQTDYIEYIVIGAETPKVGIQRYTSLVGRAPALSEKYPGLWQSKLRYQTLQELKDVYQGYQKRNIDLSVLVIDYYHWTNEGSFEFDDTYWHGIDEFSRDCRATLMVSVWPTVDRDCPFLQEYADGGHLIQQRSNEIPVPLFQESFLLDMTKTETQEIVREKLIRNYLNRGIRLFWADQAEPELSDYQHSTLQVSKGAFATYASEYSVGYLSAIPNNIDDMQPILIRSAWFGSQKKGALAWSGDIESSFESLAKQIQVGLSMGLSGQAWWTSDIGGFHAYTSDHAYQQDLMQRWFQFAVFSPILRMHGDRQPHTPSIGQTGGGLRTSGAGNEIWSFGSELENCFVKYIQLRQRLIPYLVQTYKECNEYGYPIMRPLFMEFPDDHYCWDSNLQYMLGSEILVAPVVQYNQEEMNVYLPQGHEWTHLFTKQIYKGGKTYTIQLDKETIPVFVKTESSMSEIFENVTIDWSE